MSPLDRAVRKRHGAFYTTPILADFLARSAIGVGTTPLRVLDPACGDGAFLLAARRALAARGRPGRVVGVDLMATAVERARRELSSGDGEVHVACADALDDAALSRAVPGLSGGFDLVLGNPPWGAARGPAAGGSRDTWELFVLLGLHALRPGGRLALVLPDTLLSPRKARIRRVLLERTTLEKLHNLGPDWFGADVRMSTLVVQVRAEAPAAGDFHAFVLTGAARREAIRGERSLEAFEARHSRRIPQDRCATSPTASIELYRGRRDDALIERIEAHGLPLASVCEHARGEEMSKAGRAWICPRCGRATTPGRKKKGGAFADKPCPRCGATLREGGAGAARLVGDAPLPGAVPFMDGDALCRRYGPALPRRWLRTDLAGWPYKDPALYRGPKVLIRQAGVGLMAALDRTDARCPQSVYVYRVRAALAAAGYRPELVLAALLSRTLNYVVFKRFGELDPARAHAKMTHARLAALPMPRVDFDAPAPRAAHDRIVAGVTALIDGEAPDRETDLVVERALRLLWGVTEEDGAYIDGELAALPAGQVVRALLYSGRG